MHPHIRNNGHSSLLAWVKLVGVHPMPKVPKPSEQDDWDPHAGYASSASSVAGGEAKEESGRRRREQQQRAKKKLPRPIRTKTRVFRFAGGRNVTRIVARKSCIVASTSTGYAIAVVVIVVAVVVIVVVVVCPWSSRV